MSDVIDAEIVDSKESLLPVPSQGTSLVPRVSKMELEEWGYFTSMGKTLAASGLFKDGKDVAKYVAKIMCGREMGLGPFASVKGLYMIAGGAPALMATPMAGLILGSGRYKFKTLKHDDTGCSIEFFRYDKFTREWESCGVPSTFTPADAKKAGTKNMDKYPRNMLFARALSNGARWYCADVFNGNVPYVPEDFGMQVEYDSEGNTIQVIDPSSVTVKAETTEAPKRRARKGREPGPTPQEQLEGLLENYDNEMRDQFLRAWGVSETKGLSDEEATAAVKQLEIRSRLHGSSNKASSSKKKEVTV